MKRYAGIWPPLIVLLTVAPAFSACMTLADAELAARDFSPRLQAARHVGSVSGFTNATN